MGNERISSACTYYVKVHPRERTLFHESDSTRSHSWQKYFCPTFELVTSGDFSYISFYKSLPSPIINKNRKNYGFSACDFFESCKPASRHDIIVIVIIANSNDNVNVNGNNDNNKDYYKS